MRNNGERSNNIKEVRADNIFTGDNFKVGEFICGEFSGNEFIRNAL
jgi:hypothetical protein